MTEESPSSLPQISVIIPAYNAEATLARALESLRAQTFPSWEAIVVDDGSTDGTRDLIEKIAAQDSRIRLLGLEKNGGQSAARNAGIAAARGAWVALLDADDAFKPERLENMLTYAEAENLDMVADNQIFYDAQARCLTRIAMAGAKRIVPWTLLTHLQREKIGTWFKWGLLKALIRREFLLHTGLAYRPAFRMGEDSLFYMEVLAAGAKAAVLPEPYYLYTSSRGDFSGKASGFSTSRYKLEDHLPTYLFFEKTYGSQLDAPARAALAACKRAAFNSDQATFFKEEIKRSALLLAIRRLLRHPGLAWFLALSLRRFVRLRLSRWRVGSLTAFLALAVLPFLAATQAQATDLAALQSIACLKPSQPAPTLDLTGATVTFEDEFLRPSITAPDGQGPWFAPLHSGFGGARFLPPTGPANPFSYGNGYLTIRMAKQGKGWTSGIIQSVNKQSLGFSQKYGYFEMRAQFPSGLATWPAFWLKTINENTDKTQTRAEIDVVEAYGGKDPRGHHAALHLWPAAQRQDGALEKHWSVGCYQKLDVSMFDGSFHAYGAEVGPDWTIFYFDRKEIGRVPTLDEAKQPLFLLVDLAYFAQETRPEDAPADMRVDYVRVWQRPAWRSARYTSGPMN